MWHYKIKFVKFEFWNTVLQTWRNSSAVCGGGLYRRNWS